MKIASRVSKTRDSIKTQVLETRVNCFVLTLPGQNCQVEPRIYRVYKTRDMLKYTTHTALSTSHFKIWMFKHTHSFTPFLSALSNSLTHSLIDSFIKQIRGPNLKQIRSHCHEVCLSSNRSSFSTPFIAHRAEGTLSFFWMLSRFCFLDSSVSLSPILDFGISWFDLVFGSFWVFLKMIEFDLIGFASCLNLLVCSTSWWFSGFAWFAIAIV